MKHFYRFAACFLVVFIFINEVKAQIDTTKPVKISIFAPLYLNDAFEGYTYKLDKTSIPKNMLPGLEFYNGVMMAIDSLSEENAKIQVHIYDTKQSEFALNSLFNSPELNNTGLIIASFTSSDEVKKFAQLALNKNIPLISATYPNASGVAANPFFVLLNSSFKTHLLGVYKYLQTNYPVTNIIAFRRSGSVGDYMKTTFTELNTVSAATAVKLKWVELQENFSTNDVMKHLDSTINNVILVASPIESFGLNIVKTISTFEQYRATAVGMPTWDGIKELNGNDCKNVDIVYSTPFNYMRSDNFETYVSKKYRTKYFSRPSDMVFRGYETTFHFGKLLLQYKSNLINNLSNDNFKLFNDFDIKPVKLNESNIVPDYLENKKLYFIRKQQGNIKSIS